MGASLHDDKSDMGMGKVTVERALEKSSDVAAVKLALKLGPQKFYDYIRAYGFGQRTGIELPSETRGLLRPPRRWSATSIGSLAIGQEVGVTPVQLVTMVSTIANGGVYLPPHVLMQETDEQKGDPRLKAVAFHPETSCHAAAGGRASRDPRTDVCEDADDDAGNCAGGNGHACAAERLQLGGQDGDSAEV